MQKAQRLFFNMPIFYFDRPIEYKFLSNLKSESNQPQIHLGLSKRHNLTLAFYRLPCKVSHGLNDPDMDFSTLMKSL